MSIKLFVCVCVCFDSSVSVSSFFSGWTFFFSLSLSFGMCADFAFIKCSFALKVIDFSTGIYEHQENEPLSLWSVLSFFVFLF